MSNLKKSKLRNDTGDLLKASYLPQKDAKAKMAKRGYGYDDQLSTMNTKVFISPDGKPVISHRGTKTIKDIADDALVALGLGKWGFCYKNAKRITDKAEKSMDNRQIQFHIAWVVGLVRIQELTEILLHIMALQAWAILVKRKIH